MMDFWPGNQLSPYAKFGTLPGRNCTQNYHDRHQSCHFPPPFYYDQPDPGRDSGYWSVPAPRTRAAPQDYANWTDPEMTAGAPAHFPFVLDRHSQRRRDPGASEPQEARDREWTAAREYERGFLRDGWRRGWEPCTPPRYNRELCKRSDSSYRELEAWAARYSHSLPRRRRMEAELRGASQGLLEASGDAGTGPERSRYPPPAPEPARDKTGYQRRGFSQPPGYIAPPPYNSPHKSSPAPPLPPPPQSDFSWELNSKSRSSAPPPPPPAGKLPASVDPQDGGEREKDLQAQAESQKTISEPERREAGGVTEELEKRHGERQGASSGASSGTSSGAQRSNVKREASSKVIEGRKFRLNKKTGGMTVFCLVSRIAGVSGSPSLPICNQTDVWSSEPRGASSLADVQRTAKLADEVDYGPPAPAETSHVSVPSGPRSSKDRPAEKAAAPPRLVENPLNGVDTPDSPGKANGGDAGLLPERPAARSTPPPPPKYPLWREPSFSGRAGPESPSDGVRRARDGEEDGLPLVDTTCVVVKMELIPSPQKERVHFLDSEENAELSRPVDGVRSVGPPDRSAAAERETESSRTGLAEEPQGRIRLAAPEREAVEERAQRILGISLQEGDAGQQPEDAESILEAGAGDEEDRIHPAPETRHRSVDGEKVFREREDQERPENPTEGNEDLGGNDSPAPPAEASDGPRESEIQPAPGVDPSSEPPPESAPDENGLSDPISTPEPPDGEDPDPGPTGTSTIPEDGPGPESGEPDRSRAPSPPCETPPPVTPGSTGPSSSHPPRHSMSELTEAAPVSGPPAREEPPAEATRDETGDAVEDEGGEPVLDESEPEGTEDDESRGEDRRAVEEASERSEEETPEISKQSPEESSLSEEDDPPRRRPETTCGDAESDLSVEEHADAEGEDLREVLERTLATPEENTAGGRAETEAEVLSGRDGGETGPSSCATDQDMGSCHRGNEDAASPAPQTTAEETGGDAETRVRADLQSRLQEENAEFAPPPETSSAPDLSAEAPDLREALPPPPPPAPSSPSEPVTPPSPAPPPKGGEGDSPDPALPDEHQYPKSLWDAVNRIRKHTAPDSENEEEEVNEPWDPESAGDDAAAAAAADDNGHRKTPGYSAAAAEKEAGDGAGGREVSEEGSVRKDSGPELPNGLTAEEDTLSCSSTSSHDSGETVIVADEDEDEEEEEDEAADGTGGEADATGESQSQEAERNTTADEGRDPRETTEGNQRDRQEEPEPDEEDDTLAKETTG